jgi:hypothetical protein
MNTQSFKNQRHLQIIKSKQILSEDKLFTCQKKLAFNLNTGSALTYQQLSFDGKSIIFHKYIGVVIKTKKKNQLLRITLIPLTHKKIDTIISIYINNPIIQNCQEIGKILKHKSKLYYITKKLNNLNLKKQLLTIKVSN